MADWYVATTGDDTTGDGSVGTPYATPGKALGAAITAAAAGFRILVKAGTYTTTTNTANVAGGRLDFTLSGTQSAFNQLIGYTSTVGDGGKFTFALGTTFVGPLVNTNNANSYNEIRNINFVGNATSGNSAINMAGRSNRIINIKVSGFVGSVFTSIVTVAANATLSQCEIGGGTTGANGALLLNGTANVTDVWQHGNAGYGIRIASGGNTILDRVASCDNTGANGHGFFIDTSGEVQLRRCASWGHAQSGIKISGSNASAVLDDCVIGANGAYDVDNNTAANSVIARRCAIKTSTSGQFHTAPTTNESPTTLTGVPFTNYGSGDFSLNNTAGAGAACKGVSATLFNLTTSYADTGLAQSQAISTIIVIDDD